MKAQNHSYYYLTLIISLLLMSTILLAQKQHQENRSQELSDSEHIEKKVKKLAERLSLTTDQKEKISSLYFSHFMLIKEINESEGQDSEEKSGQMNMLKSELDENIIALLNDEQMMKFEKFKKNRKLRSNSKNRN